MGVIFGGRSGEHEVSLASARSVVDAMDRERYEVVPIGITKQGRWIVPEDPDQAFREGLDGIPGRPAAILPDPAHRGLMMLDQAGQDAIVRLDVVFPVLHGPMGEDGTVQGLLELAQIPYVGAGVLGSAAGMDKVVMKILFRAVGLPGPDFTLVTRSEWEMRPDEVRGDIESQFSYPIFVKPANLGSSVGISKVHCTEELAPALDMAAKYDRRIIIEEGVADAREIEVSVLGNDFPQASVPGEVIPSREFYDYEAKYIDEGSRLLIPAPLVEDAAEEIREMAIQAYQAVDCAGMARVDFFYRESDHRILVNEINSLPGFTKISMYPKLWAATDLPFSELIDRLIQLALERHSG